jgi:hypothetical protein
VAENGRKWQVPAGDDDSILSLIAGLIVQAAESG